MRLARLFVVGQCLFLTIPFALGLSIYVADRTGNSFAPFLFILPYMVLALLAQLFRCPKCGARTYSLERASTIGYRKYLTPKFLITRCWNCSASFWRSQDPPIK